MTLHLGDVPASSTLYIPFATYDSNGASVTLTGLAVTDIEIYADGGTTQRSSDAGYTLLDTDGIDFDTITGIHGFSIDLSDNTDAGFYAVGSFYWVVVSSVTVDSQTVNFIAATFRIVPAEASSGVPDVNVASTDSGAITNSSFASNAVDSSALATNAVTEIASGVWDRAQASHTNAGSFGEMATEIASILVDTAEIGAAGAGLTEAGGTGDQLTAIPWNSAWDAEVQSEVEDALTAARAEPTGVPAANESLVDKIGYLAMALRNQITITATKKTFYDDAGNAEWEKDLSDADGTYTETEANAI